eukprot:Rmarinus@m.1071
MQVIMKPPGPGETHGCPFATHDGESLAALLGKMNVQGTDGAGASYREKAVQLAKNKNYQIACSCVFQALHPGAADDPITHPNGYYDRSFEYRKNGGPTDPEVKFVGRSTGTPSTDCPVVKNEIKEEPGTDAPEVDSKEN